MPIFRRSNRRAATPPSRCPRTPGPEGPEGNGIGFPDHEIRQKPSKPAERTPNMPIFRRSNRRAATHPSRCPRDPGPVGPDGNGIGGPDHELRPFFAAPEAVRYSPPGHPPPGRTRPNPTERVRRLPIPPHGPPRGMNRPPGGRNRPNRLNRPDHAHFSAFKPPHGYPPIPMPPDPWSRGT